MANYSSILAWKIPWTEELNGLQSIKADTMEQLRHVTVTETSTACMS